MSEVTGRIPILASAVGVRLVILDSYGLWGLSALMR